MFKTLYRPPATHSRRQVLYSRATSRILTRHQWLWIVRAIVARLIVQLEDWYCHLSYNPTISGATTYDCSRLVAQPHFCFRHQSSTNYKLSKEFLIACFWGFASSYLKFVHTCSYGGTSATTTTIYNIDSTTDAATATGYYCWNFVSQTTKTSSTKKTSTILGACLQFENHVSTDVYARLSFYRTTTVTGRVSSRSQLRLVARSVANRHYL